MNREELIEFLKQNLKVEIDVGHRGSEVRYATVKLKLNGEQISEDHACLSNISIYGGPG